MGFFLIICGSFLFSAQAAGETISYSGHVEDIGWMSPVSNGQLCGTTGQAKRLEGIKVNVTGLPVGSGVEYQAHVQDIGWMNPVSNGSLAGTEGLAKRVEAFKIQLTGPAADSYDVYYRTHISDFGWLDWTSNFNPAGSEGLAKRMEAIEIVIKPKGSNAPGSTNRAFIKKASVNYSTNVRSLGWQNSVADGTVSGTEGRALPVEAIKATLADGSGSIQYNSYVNGEGWITPQSDGASNGIEGKYLEAVQFVLAGEASNLYDIYYRTHVSDIGWMGWAKNGESAGTTGGDKQIEAIQLTLTSKNAAAPGSTSNAFQKLTKAKTAVPGLRTVKNFLQTALMPVGQVNYVYGGGWNEADNAAGIPAVSIGIYPQWVSFYNQQNSSYNYLNHKFEIYNGLDCSGYVGWAVYNTLNSTNGGAGEVYWADDQAKWYAQKGYGSFTSYGNVTSFKPGDVVSMDKDAHVYIVVGQCPDGSLVIAHSSPPGVMLSGTKSASGAETQATQLARYYMNKYFNNYYNRYSSKLDRTNIYKTRCSKMSWSPSFVGDPDGITQMNAQQVLQTLLGD